MPMAPHTRAARRPAGPPPGKRETESESDYLNVLSIWAVLLNTRGNASPSYQLLVYVKRSCLAY